MPRADALVAYSAKIKRSMLHLSDSGKTHLAHADRFMRDRKLSVLMIDVRLPNETHVRRFFARIKFEDSPLQPLLRIRIDVNRRVPGPSGHNTGEQESFGPLPSAVDRRHCRNTLRSEHVLQDGIVERTRHWKEQIVRREASPRMVGKRNIDGHSIQPDIAGSIIHRSAER